MNFQPLKDFLDFYLPMLGVPGSDTVIYKDHDEIFRYTSGFDSIQRRTMLKPDRLYSLYSCTKVATCVAAVQLIERGELVVTDPVYAYFPEFKNLTVALKDAEGRTVDVRPVGKTMLVSHLLTMTSGITYNMDTQAIKDVVSSTDGRAPTLDICRAIAAEPLAFEPGEGYQYGLSLDVIGGIVELVSGERFSDYVKANIFDPLGMKDTSFHIDESKRDRFAAKYNYNAVSHTAEEIPFDDCPFVFGSEYDSGGAGVISSVDDYILLADALANGGMGKSGNRILSEYGVRLMSTNCLNEKQLSQFADGHNSSYGYGYGVRVNLNPAPYGNIAPKGEFGWDGAKLSYISSDPETHIAVFHAEHMGGVHRVVIPRLRNLIYSCIGY